MMNTNFVNIKKIMLGMALSTLAVVGTSHAQPLENGAKAKFSGTIALNSIADYSASSIPVSGEFEYVGPGDWAATVKVCKTEVEQDRFSIGALGYVMEGADFDCEGNTYRFVFDVDTDDEYPTTLYLDLDRYADLLSTKTNGVLRRPAWHRASTKAAKFELEFSK